MEYNTFGAVVKRLLPNEAGPMVTACSRPSAGPGRWPGALGAARSVVTVGGILDVGTHDGSPDGRCAAVAEIQNLPNVDIWNPQSYF